VRAAWAGSSGLRQELFQVACGDLEGYGTSISYYKACMRCSFGYLVSWGSLAVIPCYIMEGPKREVILLWRRSNMELCKLFLCGNRLLRHDIQLAINLSQDILAGVTWWGWPILRDQKRIIIFRDNEWFSEKPIGSLNYWVQRLQMLKIHLVWYLLGDNLAFRDFRWLNFPTFPVRGDRLKYFGKLLVDLIEFHTFKEFFYLSVFLDI